MTPATLLKAIAIYTEMEDLRHAIERWEERKMPSHEECMQGGFGGAVYKSEALTECWIDYRYRVSALLRAEIKRLEGELAKL